MIKIKFPKKKTIKEIEFFFKKKGLNFIVEQSKIKSQKVNQMVSKNPYKPELVDLYRLYQYIVVYHCVRHKQI